MRLAFCPLIVLPDPPLIVTPTVMSGSCGMLNVQGLWGNATVAPLPAPSAAAIALARLPGPLALVLLTERITPLADAMLAPCHNDNAATAAAMSKRSLRRPTRCCDIVRTF